MIANLAERRKRFGARLRGWKLRPRGS
jgi:hypothetical protein